jgi:hypothetical protein
VDLRAAAPSHESIHARFSHRHTMPGGRRTVAAQTSSPSRRTQREDGSPEGVHVRLVDRVPEIRAHCSVGGQLAADWARHSHCTWYPTPPSNERPADQARLLEKVIFLQRTASAMLFIGPVYNLDVHEPCVASNPSTPSTRPMPDDTADPRDGGEAPEGTAAAPWGSDARVSQAEHIEWRIPTRSWTTGVIPTHCVR